MDEPPSRGVRAWFFDEFAHAGRENLDECHVARYDDKEDADAEREVQLLHEAGLTPVSRVVEFGPGTGQFTVRVAPACARVTAVDVSPLMLTRLRAKVSELGLDNVELVQAGFLSYLHDGPPADFVYSRFALHHLPDFWKAVALMRVWRIMRPGGMLRLWDVVYDFAPSEVVERLEGWFATAGDSVETDWTRAELEEHVRDEHSTFSWLMEAIIERTGFEVLDARRSADGLFVQYLLRAVGLGLNGADRSANA
jgi:ubiquinone/menaquinone biosynthesis C-methylase UbiE